MMFIVPASKMSVPEKVVYRMVVNGSANSMPPDTIHIVSVVSSRAKLPDQPHLLFATFVKVADPYVNIVAAELHMNNPVVLELTALVQAAVGKTNILKYPEDKIPFAAPPTLIIALEVPFVESPYTLTVILLTQLGIPVKSTLVPLAVCAVANVNDPA
jgi:hypothetical protein